VIVREFPPSRIFPVVDSLTVLAMAAGRGETDAAAQFIRASQAEVWRLCAHLGRPADPDDLTQETYLRAFRSLGRFRADASARTWLLTIARRVCADAVRDARRRRTKPGVALPVAVPDPAAAVGVRDLIDGLDDERRTAFALTQVLGLSYAEAAEICGCPVGTIRSRVARARMELLRRLGDGEAAATI
jgi:RNA polymerase sigma-70 factor, ECF subfamily